MIVTGRPLSGAAVAGRSVRALTKPWLQQVE